MLRYDGFAAERRDAKMRLDARFGVSSPHGQPDRPRLRVSAQGLALPLPCARAGPPGRHAIEAAEGCAPATGKRAPAFQACRWKTGRITIAWR